MMSQARLAPVVSITRVRLMAAALVAVSALAVGLLGPARASADGSVNNCSYVAVNIACVGQVNGALLSVTFGDVASNNDLNVLTNSLNDAILSVANISDINILSVDLNTAVQTIANTVVTTTTTTTTKTCTAVVTPPATATSSSAITISCS
jgi:hypothetical protein